MTSEITPKTQEIQEHIRKQTTTGKDTLEKKHYRRLQMVTPTLFAQFLAEKGVSDQCIACGHNKLSTPETMSVDSTRSQFKGRKHSELSEEEKALNIEAMAVHYVTPVIIDNDKVRLISNYQYRLICQNCGFISYFHAANIVSWVEDHITERKDES